MCTPSGCAPRLLRACRTAAVGHGHHLFRQPVQNLPLRGAVGRAGALRPPTGPGPALCAEGVPVRRCSKAVAPSCPAPLGPRAPQVMSDGVVSPHVYGYSVYSPEISGSLVLPADRVTQGQLEFRVNQLNIGFMFMRSSPRTMRLMQRAEAILQNTSNWEQACLFPCPAPPRPIEARARGEGP